MRVEGEEVTFNVFNALKCGDAPADCFLVSSLETHQDPMSLVEVDAIKATLTEEEVELASAEAEV